MKAVRYYGKEDIRVESVPDPSILNPRGANRLERGQIDPSFIITHRVSLDDAPDMYNTFREKHDGCIKVVIKPGERTSSPAPRSH